MLDILAAPSALYQSLTLIGKDCGHLGKKAPARIQRDRTPALILTPQTIARARGGHGEQAWL
jgi:hypothetical protein